MKKISLALTLSLGFIGASAHAQTNTPKQNQQELAARVNYSREQLKVLMEQVLNQNPKDINHADYMKKITPFIQLVEAKMDSFDQYLQNTLLPTLESEITYYNSVVLDKESSEDQIEQTLPGLYQRIQLQVNKVKDEYAKQILGLYEVFGNYPNKVTGDLGFSKILTLNNRNIRLQETKTQDAVITAFEDYVLPMIAEGCESFTCITYSASDYAKLLEGLSAKIDQDFVITLADKKTLVIPAVKLNVKTAINFIKTKTYPKWVLELPIDSKQ